MNIIINNQSINVTFKASSFFIVGGGGGGAAWGDITGTLSNQIDLQAALDNKQNTLISGTNIKTINSQSILGAGNIPISGGGGAVDSVNSQTGVVTLDQDDIPDGATFKQYSLTEKNKLASITEIFTTALKTAYDAASNWVITNGSNVLSHIASVANPHSVTKAQVGLSNVDNTSDINKPVSTATQTELNNKVSKTGDTMTGELQLRSSASLGDNNGVIQKVEDDGAGKGRWVWLFNNTSDFPIIATLTRNVSNTLDTFLLLGKLNVSNNKIEAVASPTVGSDAANKTYVDTELTGKQNTLISGTNIKTINSESILGAGDLPVAANDPFILGLQALGSDYKTQTFGFTIVNCNTFTSMGDNVPRTVAVYLPVATTITGVTTYARNTGAFTADHTNAVGLYSYSAGVLTKVAETANDPTLWTAPTNTYKRTAFTSSYAAAAGVYYVILLYNASASTVVPQIAAGTALNSTPMGSPAFTNSAKLYGTFSASNSLPASYNATDIVAGTIPFWVALY